MSDTPRWHPFLAADERTPGVWTMVDTSGRDYGTVRIVRRGNEVGYVGELRGTVVGRWTKLRAALEGVHLEFIRGHAPGGSAAARYPTNDKSPPRPHRT